MSAPRTEATLQAAFDLVTILESSSKAELDEGGVLEDSVSDLLSLVGKDELVCQLTEARDVTSSLRGMGAALSPATFSILSAAADRAEMALERAESLGPRA